MKRRGLVACGLLAMALVVIPCSGYAVDATAAKERVGVRVGGVATFDGLNDAYGDGWSLTLFLTERISGSFLLDIRLGALYLGDLKLTELDDQLTNTPNVQGAMRVLYFSAGPMVGFSLGGPYSMYAGAGLGVYSVSMQFDTGISAFDFSDQQLGFNGGLGLVRRISTNWSMEANGAVHYFLIDEAETDLYYAFTDGADPPLLLDITFALVLDLR